MRYRLASGAVLKLAPSLYGKGHIIYTDQFYTSPHLLLMLRQVELSGCGTVMSNRKYFPKKLIKPREQCSAHRLALTPQHGEIDPPYTFSATRIYHITITAQWNKQKNLTQK